MTLGWHDDVNECCRLNQPELRRIARRKTSAPDDRQFEDDVTQDLLKRLADLHVRGKLRGMLNNNEFWEASASFKLKDHRKKDKRWQAECPECGRVLQYSRKQDRTCRFCNADVPNALFSLVKFVSASVSGSGTALQLPSGTVGASHCAQMYEMRVMVQSLDPVSRQIVRLRFYHNFSLREISEWTGMTVDAVKQTLQQALQLLNNRLDDPQGGANEV